MMMLNIKILKLIIPENASFVRSYDENPTQNFFVNYICCFFLLAPLNVSLLQN
jgi:hypothetical protein